MNRSRDPQMQALLQAYGGRRSTRARDLTSLVEPSPEPTPLRPDVQMIGAPGHPATDDGLPPIWDWRAWRNIHVALSERGLLGKAGPPEASPLPAPPRRKNRRYGPRSNLMPRWNGVHVGDDAGA